MKPNGRSDQPKCKACDPSDRSGRKGCCNENDQSTWSQVCWHWYTLPRSSNPAALEARRVPDSRFSRCDALFERSVVSLGPTKLGLSLQLEIPCFKAVLRVRPGE